MLMVDSDVIVPRDAIANLLAPPESIVLGCYRYKNETGDVPLFRPAPINGSDKWNWNDIEPKRFAIKCGGLGCAMVDVSLFAELPKPWFHWDERPSGCHTSEDIWFCELARKYGHEVWADGRVRCRHVGRKVY